MSLCSFHTLVTIIRELQLNSFQDGKVSIFSGDGFGTTYLVMLWFQCNRVLGLLCKYCFALVIHRLLLYINCNSMALMTSKFQCLVWLGGGGGGCWWQELLFVANMFDCWSYYSWNSSILWLRVVSGSESHGKCHFFGFNMKECSDCSENVALQFPHVGYDYV